MKISYREKIVLLVVVVLTVILIFVMWPIKNLRASIKEHQATHAAVKEVYDENHRIINEIPKIEANITKIYDESKGINDTFVLHKENFEIDEYVQNILNNSDKFKGTDKNKFEVLSSFVQSEAVADTLSFYYSKPSVITYTILENADINGDLLEKNDPALYKKVNDAVIIEELEEQEVELHQGTISARFTKDSLFDFIDLLEEKETGIIVDNVTITDYHFNNDQPAEFYADPVNKDLEGYTDGIVALSFYTMEEIQEPVFD